MLPFVRNSRYQNNILIIIDVTLKSIETNFPFHIALKYDMITLLNLETIVWYQKVSLKKKGLSTEIKTVQLKYNIQVIKGV